MRKLLIWAPLALFLGVAIVFASGLKPTDRTIRSALIDKPLPEINLPPILADKDGIKGGFGEGKPRLINVFASWCLPCIAEVKQLMKLKEMGVEIDGIATADTPDAMQAFLQEHGDPYARIGDDRNRSAQFSLGSAGVPETFVVDARGRVIKQHIGDIRAEHIPELLAALEAGK